MPSPPPGFVWHQRDAVELRCTDCGEIVRGEVVDLHRCKGGD